MTTIPLSRAYLCLDCDGICDSPTMCPNCATGHLLALAGVLNRREAIPAPANAPRAAEARQ